MIFAVELCLHLARYPPWVLVQYVGIALGNYIRRVPAAVTLDSLQVAPEGTSLVLALV